MKAPSSKAPQVLQATVGPGRHARPRNEAVRSSRADSAAGLARPPAHVPSPSLWSDSEGPAWGGRVGQVKPISWTLRCLRLGRPAPFPVGFCTRVLRLFWQSIARSLGPCLTQSQSPLVFAPGSAKRPPAASTPVPDELGTKRRMGFTVSAHSTLSGLSAPARG
jgi:hypothetical protein